MSGWKYPFADWVVEGWKKHSDELGGPDLVKRFREALAKAATTAPSEDKRRPSGDVNQRLIKTMQVARVAGATSVMSKSKLQSAGARSRRQNVIVQGHRASEAATLPSDPIGQGK